MVSLATGGLLKYSNKTVAEQGRDILQVKVTSAITSVGVTVNFRPLDKRIIRLGSTSCIWSKLFLSMVLVLTWSAIAWILGVNNVYHDVLQSLSIETLAALFFTL